MQNRSPKDIDNLWELFESAIELSRDNNQKDSEKFEDNFNQVIGQYGVHWNITIGLYWIRPWDYIPLDSNTRKNLSEKLKINTPNWSQHRLCTGQEYLNIIEEIKGKFELAEYPVDSFPKLSYLSVNNELLLLDEVNEECLQPYNREEIPIGCIY